MRHEKTEFIVLCGQIVGDGSTPYRTEYGFDGERFADRAAAIAHGFTMDRSDDFNIGVVTGGKLVSVDWMDEAIDTDPALMAEISEQIFLADE